MKTPGERGPYGRWLVAARLERDLRTAEDARDALTAAGISIAKSTYAEYESGTKQPSKNHLPELERFFGAFKDPVAAAPSVLDPYVVLDRHAAAMEAQAEAITKLAASLDAMATRVTDRVEDAASAFEDVVAALRMQQPTTGDVSPDASGHAQ